MRPDGLVIPALCRFGGMTIPPGQHLSRSHTNSYLEIFGIAIHLVSMRDKALTILHVPKQTFCVVNFT